MAYHGRKRPKREDGTALMEQASIRIATLEDSLAQANRAIQLYKQETDEARNLIDALSTHMVISSQPVRCYVLALDDVVRITKACKNRTTRDLWNKFIGKIR